MLYQPKQADEKKEKKNNKCVSAPVSRKSTPVCSYQPTLVHWTQRVEEEERKVPQLRYKGLNSAVLTSHEDPDSCCRVSNSWLVINSPSMGD